MQLAWLSAMKLHYASARLEVFTNPFGDGFRAAMQCCPYVDSHEIVPSGGPDQALADVDASTTYAIDSEHLFHLNLALCQIRAPFVIPEPKRAALRDELVGRGVDPDRWIVTLHCRHDSSFRMRSPDAFVRDVARGPFEAAAEHIIERQGGQVIWLGHPEMPAPPARSGAVSIADAPMLLQYFAIASSRFFVGCDSGPVMCASAFEVPVLKSNSIYDSGCWNSHDIMLPKNVLTADGAVLSFARSERALHWMPAIHQFEDFVLLDNTFEQLRHCIDQLRSASGDISGWRPLQSLRRIEAPPDAFPMLPRRVEACRQLVDLSHLLGRPVVHV
jgi:putative glycosyltransferase (TIGR04372 family)